MTFGNLTKSLIRQGFLLFILTIVAFSKSDIDDSSTLGFCDLWNAALCKPASQKSVFYGGTADRALDGNRDTEFFGLSCMHTFSKVNNWWVVDLMDEYLVHKVIITNRAKPNHYRFTSVIIDLFLSDPRLDSSFPNNTDGTLCTNVITAFEETKTFDCELPSYGRYVKLFKTNEDLLNFCEMEVMVSKKRGDAGCRKTVVTFFDNVKNSIAENGHIVLNTTTHTALTCARLCAEDRDYCKGFYWTEATKDCQILKVNPYDLGKVVKKEGTHFYVEPMIECLGNDGIWKYV